MPLVVKTLVGAIVLAFLPAQFLLDAEQRYLLALQYGVRPFNYEAGIYQNWFDAAVPLMTHVFLHAGWFHLGMNMLGLLQGGPFVARRLGALRFLLLFFLSAIGGGIAFILISKGSEIPAVGASGAICGVFAAYFLAVRPTPQAAIADPQVRNAMLMFLGINVVLFAFLNLPIAWEAHLGGFVVGALAYPLLAPRRRLGGPWG